MKPKVNHRKLNPKKAPELAKLAHQVGQFIEYWGFKSVQGRLWLYLYVSKEPLSSIELSDLLGISPALVTQSVQVLINYKVILTAPKGVNGVLRYQSNPNVAESIRFVLESRESQLLIQTETQIKKTKSEWIKENHSGFKMDSDKLNHISDWLVLFQGLLQFGMSTLGESQSPFSDTKTFIKELP